MSDRKRHAPPLPECVEVVLNPTSYPHAPTSRYAEMYWLPVIGPTAWALARRLSELAENGEVLLAPALFAVLLGVGVHVLHRAVARLVGFGLARWRVRAGNAVLMLDAAWPDVATHHARRVEEVRL